MKKIIIMIWITALLIGITHAQGLTQAVIDRVNNDMNDINSKQVLMNSLLGRDAILQNDIQVLNSDIQSDQNDIVEYNTTVLREAQAVDAQVTQQSQQLQQANVSMNGT